MHKTALYLATGSLCLVAPAYVQAANAPQLTAAETLKPATNIDLQRYLVSEKLDGVRAYWTGKELLTRSGQRIDAPAWFTQGLPPVPLDGELWAGRGQFQQVSQLVRRFHGPDSDWRHVHYMLFDLPAFPAPFGERTQRLQALVKAVDNSQIRYIEQRQIQSRDALDELLNTITDSGGEGLVLHDRLAHYTPTRSERLLKYKRWQDEEARVVGYTQGKGKYTGMTGALVVEDRSGLRFRIGSGLSDALRQDPPALGSWITFRFNGRTVNGKPRFARFLRMYDQAL